MNLAYAQRRRATALLVLLPALYATPIWSHDVITGGRIVSTPQELNRKLQAGQPSNVPGSPHRHVYQRQEYGKNYRRGHSVSGPYGNITIWSAAPVEAYQAPARSRAGHMRNQQAVPPTGPRLQYDPDYGKPPKDKR